MKRRDISRTGWATAGRRIAVVAAASFASLAIDAAAHAQTHTARDTATAYGARLNASGEPANLNPSRINNRINSRLDTRLSLRIERYRPDNTNDPAAAFAVKPSDNARIGSDATLSPLSTSAPSSMVQAFEASVQTSPRASGDAARPR